MIQASRAISVSSALMAKLGVPDSKAELTARAIVTSDVWGSPSHGLMRLPFYLQRLAAGGINPVANLHELSHRGAVRSFDGSAGLGHWQLWEGGVLGAASAKESGISLVSIKNSNHCGALGVYVYPALDASEIALVFTNGPAVMPAIGGNSPLLSTSPIAVGIPATQPIIIDLATSSVARGKIAAAAKNGESIPEGWAVDASGNPVTDAKAALQAMLAPLGGAKGFALGLMVEAISAGISGGALATEVPDMFNSEADQKPQEISHTVITIDPQALGETTAYQRFDEMTEGIIKSGGRVPGGKRIHPRDIDNREIKIAEPVLVDLNAWSDKLGVAKLA